MQQIMPDPLWDEGIASFLYSEYEKKQEPFSMVDLEQFAREQAVRVGDILETLFLMAIYGAWQYTDDQGVPQKLDEEALNELYARGRLNATDLAQFPGVWSPVQ